MRSIFCVLGAWAAAMAPAAAAERPAAPETYRQLAGEVEQHWQELLGLWFPRVIDRQQGGFWPHFREDWSKGPENDKTIVFQARMTWVAAEVAQRYPSRRQEFLPYVRHGVDFLKRVMWDQEQGGFYWGLDGSGKVSPRYGTDKHLYGMAFGIYGAAAAYRATGDAGALALAQQAFHWLDRHAHDARYGGYHEALSRDGTPIVTGAAANRPGRTDQIGAGFGYKSMNAHIHLLEALTELSHAWPDATVRQRLGEVFLVVRDKIAVEPGCLNLYFTPDWRPVPDHDSFGHDVETGYLLIEAAEALRATGAKDLGALADDPRTLRVSRALVDHGLDWGWDDRMGGFYDKGGAFKAAWERDKIWWTQAEGLNVLLLMHELFARETPRYWNAFVKQWDFIRRHQVDSRHGGWYESVSAEGQPKPGQAKATIWKAAYHDGRALMNVARRLDRLAGKQGPGDE